jgi:hypothetical protein
MMDSLSVREPNENIANTDRRSNAVLKVMSEKIGK